MSVWNCKERNRGMMQRDVSRPVLRQEQRFLMSVSMQKNSL
jgi:hypothetical protein